MILLLKARGRARNRNGDGLRPASMCGMRMSVARFAIVVLLLAAAAGCTASGASTGNFDLKPDRLGWYVGERAHFTLNLTPSLTKQAPDYVIDRNFALEEIRFDERGATVGGDFETRNPDDLKLTLVQNGTEGQEFTLNHVHPGIDIYLDIPEKLRDSQYVLEVKLFKVGWIKSEPFRVDEK